MPSRTLPERFPTGPISLALASALLVAGLSACSDDPVSTGPSSGASSSAGGAGVTGSGPGSTDPATGTVVPSRTPVPASQTGVDTPRHRPTPTPADPGIQAVLDAFDAMDSHGPYRITMTTGAARAFLDVVPPGSAHYYVTPGTTVGEEIEIDGAVWIRGADGRWTPTDGMTQTAPRLTVTDIAQVTRSGQGTAGGRTYRTYSLTGTWHDEALRATAEVWTDKPQLRRLQLTTAVGATDYTFDYAARPTITPPAP